MITEKDAKQMYCPFLGTERNALPDPYTEEYGVAPLLCRGSHCMAWRVGKLPNPKVIEHDMPIEERLEILEKDLDDPPHPEGVPQSYIFTINPHRAFWVEDDESCKARRKGYCGMVGKPEVTE